MRGVGRSSAAVSIVNAIPAGLGCAVGVRLYAAVSVDLEPSASPGFEVEPGESATPVLKASLRQAIDAAAPGRSFVGRVEVRSEIPPAKGLKSSSAVSSAAVLAVFRALDHPSTPEEVARLAAAAGRASGASLTGAFDDALAGLVPGFVVTDNRTDRLLRQAPADPGTSAVIHAPDSVHPPVGELRRRLRGEAEEARRAGEEAIAGRWAEAMDRNSRLVERALGYDYRELRERLRAAGAWASGVSGSGPALAALVDPASVSEVLAATPPARFVVPLATEGAR